MVTLRIAIEAAVAVANTDAGVSDQRIAAAIGRSKVYVGQLVRRLRQGPKGHRGKTDLDQAAAAALYQQQLAAARAELVGDVQTG
jgi:hypothetical protein